MHEKPSPFPVISAIALLSLINGCGGSSNHTLESISISPSSASGTTASYIAVGNYNISPVTVKPLSVSWYLMGPGVDPPPASYSLAATPFTSQRCSALQGKATGNYVVIAIAPIDPAAPNSGTVPSQVFEDMVIARSSTAEGGFLSATAMLSCP